jgi:hypothetical protein
MTGTVALSGYFALSKCSEDIQQNIEHAVP